jgi:hypothetical protein
MLAGAGRRAPGGSAHALLCRWGAGWLGAWSLTAPGALAGPTAKSTVGIRRLVPAGAHHGNPRPVGSAARRMRALVRITGPSPSRRTGAGMVVMLNLANRAFPRGPATVACSITVQLGILKIYCTVSSAEVLFYTKKMVALLHRQSNATRDWRNGPHCGQDSGPK